MRYVATCKGSMFPSPILCTYMYKGSCVIFLPFRRNGMNAERTNERNINIAFTQFQVSKTAIETNNSKYLDLRGIPNDSVLPLDRNIAIYVELS